MPVEWLTDEKCRKMLGPHIYGRLATSGKDNIPYITPVNYVYMENAIYIHCAMKGRKLNNIAENPAVCFEISSPGNLYIAEKACGFTMRFWSILVSGNAHLVQGISEKREVLDAIMIKYAGRYEYTDPSDEDLEKVNVIKIDIEDISGKFSVDPE